MNAYPDLWHRLMAGTHEPENEQACWTWARRRDRWGYGRIEVYVPGLGRVVTLMAHIVAWVWLHWQPANADEMYLGYLELKASGLELDHTCEMPCCVRPDHLDPVTPSENCLRREARLRRGVIAG